MSVGVNGAEFSGYGRPRRRVVELGVTGCPLCRRRGLRFVTGLSSIKCEGCGTIYPVEMISRLWACAGKEKP